MHVIESLADFVVSANPLRVNTKLRSTCQLLVADLMAAAGAGYCSDLSEAAYKTARDIYGPGEAAVWFREQKLSILGAAMANAAAGSALDLDDGHRGAAGHAGSGVIAAVLAVAQGLQIQNDDEIFTALILGYDVALRVATSRPVESIDSWVSGRWVGFGIAAGVAKLLGLNQQQTAHAIAIVAAEGPIGFRSGSSKYLGSSVKEQIPAAAVAGITAAFRAKHGATGPLDLLDNQEKYNQDILFSRAGEDWLIQENYLKPYACCRYMHAAIDGILLLRNFTKPVISLDIETFPRGLGLTNDRAPKNLESGQYSYYFSCALAAVRGASALQPVMPESLRDAEVLALAARIGLQSHADFSTAFPRSTPCRVLLDQGDGVQEVTVLAPLGDVSNPMSFDQVIHKLKKITRQNLDEKNVNKLIEILDELTEKGFSPLFHFISPKP